MAEYRGEREARQALRRATENAGGQRAFARQHGIHYAVLCRMINGQTRVSAKFAKLVGYMRVTEYRRKARVTEADIEQNRKINLLGELVVLHRQCEDGDLSAGSLESAIDEFIDAVHSGEASMCIECQSTARNKIGCQRVDCPSEESRP